ncbi:MAG: four helix bundle protein [Candidatus Buchananbacteria bacterium]|nr:four helix bundle protein [Candidatus Buchananbacteria bacterium]
MVEITNSYDLEDRTLEYGKRIIKMAKNIPLNIVNNVLVRQVVRSGLSLGANYREANETETKKDFQFRMRICRKEAKETVYWLKLIIEANPRLKVKMELLLDETCQLLKIFAAIIEKSKNKPI